jgi:death on curing protein
MTAPVRIEPVWLDATDALAIHDRQLSEHGGLSGLRDAGLLDSAMTRPVNRWHYGEDDLSALAASYAFGVARNHPFADGNKRTAWVVARLFFVLNDAQLVFQREAAIEVMVALAAGELSEDELASWFRDHIASAN